MTTNQRVLVQTTFAKVAPAAAEVASLFYGRLFEIDPQLRPMFTSDLKEQGKKLMQVLGFAVASLDRMDTLLPAVQDLGKRHVKYGVRDEHYDTVGAALLWTLEKGLQNEFTPEVREAWTVVYTTLAREMKAAAALVAA